MPKDKEVLEFIKLAEELKAKNRESFVETKGYMKGLLQQQKDNSRKKVQAVI